MEHPNAEAAKPKSKPTTPDRPLTMGTKLYVDRMIREVFTNGIKDIANKALSDIEFKFLELHETTQKSTVEQMNAAIKVLTNKLAEADKKFTAQYGILVRTFLSKQERKIASLEVGLQSILEVTAQHLHSLTFAGKKEGDEGFLSVDDFRKQFQSKIESSMEAIATEIDTKAKQMMEATAKGPEKKADVEPAQEQKPEEAKAPDSN